MWKITKCPCGHPSCNQYTLSNQGSVGFEKDDAAVLAMSPVMKIFLEGLLTSPEVQTSVKEQISDILSVIKGLKGD